MRLTSSRFKRWFAHPLAQAGLAIGLAGAGRIVLNSLVSLHYGTALFGQYAGTVSAIILIGSLASAGPAAATTLGVARRWASAPRDLPVGLLRFLAGLLLWFLILGAGVGVLWSSVRGVIPSTLWVVALTGYAGYQVARAFGYAVQSPAAVTRSELIGALVPLALLIALIAAHVSEAVSPLIVIFVSGPIAFLVAFGWIARERVHVVPGALTAEERRAGLREGLVFFVGAGSSMTMQYLPVIIAERLQDMTTAALLFGAVQATAPLLLLSRIYGAVMMPAFAGDADDGRSQVHVGMIQPFLVSTLAIAFGIAPWVVLSLGIAPTGVALSVGALVALMTLMQVWATPAVTILSARKRELVPALASLTGLAVASLVWVVCVRTGVVLLLPVGLALGAVIRSLVPMWVISGQTVGRFDQERRVGIFGAIGVTLLVVLLARTTASIALIGGSLLALWGLGSAYRTWNRVNLTAHANPPR